MSVINTNISSMQAQSSVRTSGLNLSTAMERLSSGVRINSAKDDAAGLAISTRMTASIRGISAAIRNANDGISLTQTAEGSLAQIGDNLQRIRELAVQSANTGNNASDRAAMNNEAKQLIAEIDRVASNTKYNGIALLDGSFRGQDLQVGAGNGANDRIAISIGSAKSSTLGVGGNSSYAASKVGSSVGATALADSALNINGFSTSAAISDGVSSTLANTSGIAVAAAINAISARSNVTATVGETSVAGSTVTGFATAIAAGDVKINGVSIGPIAAASTAGGRGNQVAAAVNAVSSSTGVTATFDSTTGAVSLNAADGRNITIDAVNAGGNSAVTGLGLGTTSTMAAASAAGNTAAISNLKINGVAIADVGGISVTTTPGAAAVTVAATTAGVAGPSANQVNTATFGNLSKGQSVSFAGLTFTAAADGITAAQVASAFKSVGNTGGAIIAAAAQTKWENVSGHVAIGSFTSGTSLDGTFASGPLSTDAKFTATAPSNTPLVMAEAGTDGINPPVLSGEVLGDITNNNSIKEEAVATFLDLKRGQSVSFAGLTFTAADDITADKVATAFNSVGNTGSAITAAAAQTKWKNVSGHAAIGSFTSGTSLVGTFDGASVGTSQAKFTVTTAAGDGIVKTITSAGTASIAAPSVVATTPGKLATAQVSTATFTGLEAGASVTFAGLTFTSGTAGTKAAELQAAFASIAGTSASATTAQTFTQVNATAGALVSDAIGRFTSGTAVTGGTFAAGGSTGQVTWSAIAPTSTFVVGAATPTAPTLGTFNAGTSPNKSTVSVTFQSLTAGQSATVKGLTFTAKAAMNAADVAKAFSGLLLGETAAQVTTRNAATSSLLGTYTGTNEGGANGYTSGAATAATVLYSGAPALASTTFDSSKTAGTKSTETVVFRELSAGQSVTVNGLTFTAKAAMNAVDVGKAFSGVLTGETAAQVTTRNASTSSLLGTYTGTNTAGYASAATTTATAVYTSVSDAAVSFGTPITGSDTQTVVASTGSVESSVFTFSALKTGQSATINNLTFTAKKDLTSAEVASAFGSLTSGTSSTPANTANGDYTGSWKAGYSTAAASGATVTATATVAGSADIEFSSSKSVTAQGFTVPASTVYGTVTLKSQNTFIIKPGANANATATANATDPTFANFSALGFEAKTINAKSIGRLNFQVGPAANQLISIDLADFGKNGDITGLITSDRAPTNLLTVNSANDVIMNVNISLDRIASTRANMGAVMNRLEHVIDNLTNVVMNSEASRSQIEDADYAKASTELARTQIMQQAATAVLAQANTSQQGVLKLLQG